MTITHEGEEKELTNEDAEFLSILAGEEFRLDTFDIETLTEYLNYKWDTYAYKLHYFSAFMHAFCICTITLYIDFVYNRNDQSMR